MRSGDILLFKGGDFVARLIRWGTKSPYSHVAICVNAEMNLAIEAHTKSVRARDIRKINTDYDVFRIKEVYAYDLHKVISYLVDKLNHHYDWKGVIYLGLLKLFHLKRLSNKWQKENDYFCSELGADAFDYGGLKLCPDIIDDSITSPADIADSTITEKI